MTPAPVVGRAVLDPLHAALATKDLLPERHLVDAAYIDADGLVAAARDHDVALIGPVSKDNQWQARTEGAFTIKAFHLDWDRQIATCSGETLRNWVRQTERDKGGRAGPTTDEREWIKALEREVRELRQSNEILKKASAYFAQAELYRRFRS